MKDVQQFDTYYILNGENAEMTIEEQELYHLLLNGIQDVVNGNIRPFSEAMAEICATRKHKT